MKVPHVRWTLLLMIAYQTSAAKILGLLTLPCKSHHIWNRSLMRALVARGHQVTVLTAVKDEVRVTNLTEFVVAGMPDSEAGDPTQNVYGLSPLEFVDIFLEWHIFSCQNVFSSAGGAADLLKLVNGTAFDLVIADVTASDCQLGFIHAFGSPPWIGVTAYSHPVWISYMTGNPHNPAYVPELSTSFRGHMNFWQRLLNTVYHIYTVYITDWWYLPKVDTMVREYFGEGVPSIRDVRNNVSLVMVNTHASFDNPLPLLPVVVEVAGMHIGAEKTLPQHLKEPMDEAKEGFIYFSLGSMLRSDLMSAERRQVFLDAFSRLPYKVFWKWESDSLPGQPSNVIVSKWMPQRDILAHPNILLFVTHSGLLSTQEAIHSGVPIIGVPFFADQEVNACKAKDHGFGESVAYETVTADQLLNTIYKVVKNQRYKENARRLSKLMRDQPQSPLERAVFWTEYVIRHKGAPHLRSAAADLPLYQYLLLDVVCVLAAGVLGVLFLFYVVCRALLVLARQGRRLGKQKEQ